MPVQRDECSSEFARADAGTPSALTKL